MKNPDHLQDKDASRQVTLEEVKKMSDEELRVKVAEAYGWKHFQFALGFSDGSNYILGWLTDNEEEEGQDIPDYPHDLNAVHEVEKTMFAGYHGAYFATLGLVIGQAIQPTGWYDAFLLGTSTARQRCEAIVLCLSSKLTTTFHANTQNKDLGEH